MKVYILILGNNFYPVGYKGGKPGYPTKKAAFSASKAITKSDKEYVNMCGGITIMPVIAKKEILATLGIQVVEEK